MRVAGANGKVIIEDAKIASDFFSRFFGMICVDSKKGPFAMWFPHCSSIHMLFMRFSLDLIFLNRQKQVVKIVYSAKPWTPVIMSFRAESVLEIIPGNWDREQLRVGDYLVFDESNKP